MHRANSCSQNNRKDVLHTLLNRSALDYGSEPDPRSTLLLACDPLAGKRVVQGTQQKTSRDWASFLQDLVDVHSPKAENMVLVRDNLATHSPAAWYYTFPPAQAPRLQEFFSPSGTVTHIPQFWETLCGILIIASYTRFAALRRRQSSATMESISVQAHLIGRAKHVLCA